MKKVKGFLVLLVVVMFLAFLMKFDAIAGPVSDLIKQPIDVVKQVAGTILMIAVGCVLLYFAAPIITAGAVVIGGAMAIVGLGMIAAATYSWFKKSPEPEE